MGKSKKVISHTVSVIRDRGQLTIPDSIRAQRTWASPNSVVTISSNHPDEITIRPHKKQQYDWDKIWEAIRKARAIKGRGRGSLSKFIIEDRHRH
jgi:bifunctional DNA-binding transcriptional regulator/antitoxin component of YhaV-PrlF toxin-antitoxin module